MTAPRRRSTMSGTNLPQRSTTASTSSRSRRSWASTGIPATWPGMPTPALLQSTETLCPRRAISPARRSRSPASARSQTSGVADTPVPDSSRARASSRSRRRATRTTSCPRRASDRAISAPIPEEAPVITATASGSGGGSQDPGPAAGLDVGRGGGRAASTSGRAGRPREVRAQGGDRATVDVVGHAVGEPDAAPVAGSPRTRRCASRRSRPRASRCRPRPADSAVRDARRRRGCAGRRSGPGPPPGRGPVAALHERPDDLGRRTARSPRRRGCVEIGVHDLAGAVVCHRFPLGSGRAAVVPDDPRSSGGPAVQVPRPVGGRTRRYVGAGPRSFGKEARRTDVSAGTSAPDVIRNLGHSGTASPRTPTAPPHFRPCGWRCARPKVESVKRRRQPISPSPWPPRPGPGCGRRPAGEPRAGVRRRRQGTGRQPGRAARGPHRGGPRHDPLRRRARAGPAPRASVAGDRGHPAGHSGGLTTSVRRVLKPLLADYDHVVLDTRGDLSGLTLAAVCAVDSVLTVFTSDPGSALGAAAWRPSSSSTGSTRTPPPCSSGSRAPCGTSTGGRPGRSPAPWRAPICRCWPRASRCRAECRPARSPSCPSSSPPPPAQWRAPTWPSPTKCSPPPKGLRMTASANSVPQAGRPRDAPGRPAAGPAADPPCPTPARDPAAASEAGPAGDGRAVARRRAPCHPHPLARPEHAAGVAGRRPERGPDLGVGGPHRALTGSGSAHLPRERHDQTLADRPTGPRRRPASPSPRPPAAPSACR